MTLPMAAKVFECNGPENASVRAVLLEMAYRADGRGVVRISQTEIAALTRLSRKTVAAAYDVLNVAYEVIERQHQGRYQFRTGALDNLDAAF